MCCENKEHKHSFIPIILFIVGLILYIISLFIKSDLVVMILQLAAFFTAGYHIIIDGLIDTFKKSIVRKRFYPNIHILMLIAGLGAISIGYYSEAALLILIFAGAHFLEDYAFQRSNREITNLIKLNPKEARLLLDDGSNKLVTTSSLAIGDIVVVLNGDLVPTDGIIVKGYTNIDESAITGESIPTEKSEGSPVFASTINGNGYFEMKVTKLSHETVIAKIIEMVSQTQSNISKTAAFVKKIEPIYVNVVLILAPIFFLLGHFLLKWNLSTSFYRTMIFFIGASPCALAVTDIPATLSAISNLAKRGILFKGGSYLSIFADINVVAFDKTGTLTKGMPIVTDFININKMNYNENISILSTMESKSNHPLANAITKYFDMNNDVELEVINIIGVGLTSTYNKDLYKVGKPTSYENIDLEILEKVEILEKSGKTVVLFSKNTEIIFIIGIMDILAENAISVINYFNSNDIETVMITGDSIKTANAIGRELNIKKTYGEVLPADKHKIITNIKSDNKVIAMFGDGINDAPALVAADIGIAMGDGTDVAIDVADAVLMKNELSNIVYTHQVSKKLRRIVIQNIIFSMFIVVLLVVLNILELINIPLAVILHEGSTVIVILNGLRMLRGLGEGL